MEPHLDTSFHRGSLATTGNRQLMAFSIAKLGLAAWPSFVPGLDLIPYDLSVVLQGKEALPQKSSRLRC
jgi:hypothetical protein